MSFVRTLCSRGSVFIVSAFSFRAFRVFITVSVVVTFYRVLLITLWYICLLPGFSLFSGLTYDLPWSGSSSPQTGYCQKLDLCDLLGDFDLLNTLVLFHCHCLD